VLANGWAVSVKAAIAAVPKPPSFSSTPCGAVYSRMGVVVSIRSTEHIPVGDPGRVPCHPECIAGVSAVPVHGQVVVTSLISDGERRVFSRVPQTSITLDLLAAMRY